MCDTVFDGQAVDVDKLDFACLCKIGKHKFEHSSCLRRDRRSDAVAAAYADANAGQSVIVDEIALRFHIFHPFELTF